LAPELRNQTENKRRRKLHVPAKFIGRKLSRCLINSARTARSAQTKFEFLLKSGKSLGKREKEKGNARAVVVASAAQLLATRDNVVLKEEHKLQAERRRKVGTCLRRKLIIIKC
jgi:hypothetical protein